MDMRSKTYPLLPEGQKLCLVLPRTGDLRYRSVIPREFLRRLYIHADPRRRFWYVRFQLKRKFIVMSKQGDLYAKSSVIEITMDNVPAKKLLSMPRVACGDLVKVLDLIQCSRSEGQQWELVLTRRRNGMETWIPLEMVQLFASNLLQEFYVNSINSWGFYRRIQSGNLLVFRTEVELWLFQPEFQKFYIKLRQRRASVCSNTTISSSQQRAVQVSHQAPIKPERLPESVKTSNTTFTPLVPHVSQLPASIRLAVASNPYETVIQQSKYRGLVRERCEQLCHSQHNGQIELQQEFLTQQQQQRKIELLAPQQRLERERRLQQERLETNEELRKSAKEHDQQLRMHCENEKAVELHMQKHNDMHQNKGQEEVQHRLQQVELLQNEVPTRRNFQAMTTQTQCQQRERQNDFTFSSTSHRPNESTYLLLSEDGADKFVSPNTSGKTNDSEISAADEASDDTISCLPQKRRRKRLLYSQVELEDEDGDDLPDLSQSSRSICHQNEAYNTSKKIDSFGHNGFYESKKRLRKSVEKKNNSAISSCVDVDLTHLSGGDDDNDNDRDDNRVEIPMATVCFTLNDRHTGESHGNDNGVAEYIDGDDNDDGSLDFEPALITGEMRCVCGATSVERYGGQWLQCWSKRCSIWEHADCVGMLTNVNYQPSSNYVCSRCDPKAYLARCVKASERILDWLFQCCESRNVKQLMELLEDNIGYENIPLDWKNVRYDNRTLAMHAARNGVAQCLRYLLHDRKVDIFATDLHSRNALHHAAQGESLNCCRILLEHDRRLLLHPDLRGCMPFHCMLQSVKVNKLCISIMQDNLALVGMRDLDNNLPIHYACQAVNEHTVKICQMIVTAQPSMLLEKSSEGLYPLMILCKSTGTASSCSTRHKTSDTSEVAKHAKDVLSLILDIDVFGDCLSQKAPNGWSPLHFAAASGNHELIAHLCNISLLDVHHAAEGSGQTALHIAAQHNCPLSVRALLLEGLSVTAKDNDGWIPMLYTQNAACIQELMHYKLTKQLSRLHQMLSIYQQQGLVQNWQQVVARDPTCFDILNDWCQCNPERVERMEGLFLSNPFLLRLDNKIEYVWSNVIPSVKKLSGTCSITAEDENTDITKYRKGQRRFVLGFSRDNGCFWKQFVDVGMRLEPEDFRLPMEFSIDHVLVNSPGFENRNTDLVLTCLAASLLKEVPGLLVRGSSQTSESFCLSSSKQELATQLLEFYLLGELVAHFVLYAIPLSGRFDFNLAFLRCVGCHGKYRMQSDAPWKTPGYAFAAGFEAVLPATLTLFCAQDLWILFSGPQASISTLQIDWSTVVKWKICGSSAMGDKMVESVKAWLLRLMNELVKDEQKLVLLFMTGTLQPVNDRSDRFEGESDRLVVALYLADGRYNYDTMLPTLEHNSKILHLPSYSCYKAFKKGMLTVLRHADHAFLPE